MRMRLRTTCATAVAGGVVLALAGCTTTVVLKEDEPVTVEAEAPEAQPTVNPAPNVVSAARVKVEEDQIRVDDKIHFALDSAEIKPDSYDLLEEIAKVINDHPEIIQIRVEGHTDSQGSARYNKTLSQNRAEAVVRWLVDNGGVDESRLMAKGYGFDEPVASNDTEEGRAENRRVAFEILEREGE